MKWNKLGVIFNPQVHYPWMMTHASVPFATLLHDDIYRIYFSTRDQHQRSFVAFVDICLQEPKTILNLSTTPFLSPGHPGSFDEDGCMLSWITKTSHEDYYYYIGWNKGSSVPFRNAVGLATSDNTGIKKFSDGPILDRSVYDPCFTASVSILKEEAEWHMWYLSGIKWEKEHTSFIPYYHIKYARSVDGIHWQREGVVCIDFNHASEHAISRPCVIKENGLYKMWYSYRGKTYRIGYAESEDGLSWQRKDDEVGIDVSDKEDWDSQMIEYPFVFTHKGRKYLLYNGNDFGKTGFGMAVEEIY